jgi:hypothetical protein
VAYDLSALTPSAPTSLAWGIAWTRFILRDTNATELFSDTELVAILTAHAFTVEDDSPSGSTTYYRPHVVAANLIQSDPDRALSEGLLGATITNRDPGSIARSIRSAGRWVDDLIETESGSRPPTGRTLTPVF